MVGTKINLFKALYLNYEQTTYGLSSHNLPLLTYKTCLFKCILLFPIIIEPEQRMVLYLS